jgi:restriction system protein
VAFNFKIADNSVFAVLLRSSWWISFAVALGLLVLVRLLVPEPYRTPAISFSLPFFIIGGIVAWKQFQIPGAARVAATCQAVRTMSFKEFSALVEQAYLRDGYKVTRLSGAADFKIIRMGKITLVSCKRWKAASHGAEPLREFDRRRETEEAHDGFYVALDGITGNAREFAAKHRIHLIEGPELTSLLRLPKR